MLTERYSINSMRFYHVEDPSNESETVLIVPIDDKKSINKEFVLKNSDLLKKYFNVPTEQEEASLNLSNRFFYQDKQSQSNSNRMLDIHSNRSISIQNPSKFKYSAMDSDEFSRPVLNPFLSQHTNEANELQKKRLIETGKIRQRRRTSGAIVSKPQIPILDM